ncbi:MAG TPA: hypothetical protein VGD31_07810 [Sphingobacteriaceae bacterium]
MSTIPDVPLAGAPGQSGMHQGSTKIPLRFKIEEFGLLLSGESVI